jgi:hypothetical protein
VGLAGAAHVLRRVARSAVRAGATSPARDVFRIARASTQNSVSQSVPMSPTDVDPVESNRPRANVPCPERTQRWVVGRSEAMCAEVGAERALGDRSSAASNVPFSMQ